MLSESSSEAWSLIHASLVCYSHVWKDIAITCFLILLWKDMYPALETRRRPTRDSLTSEDRSTWGGPPGGFVDVGCGNGLLVHILTSEVRPTLPFFRQ